MQPWFWTGRGMRKRPQQRTQKPYFKPLMSFANKQQSSHLCATLTGLFPRRNKDRMKGERVREKFKLAKSKISTALHNYAVDFFHKNLSYCHEELFFH